MLCISHEDLVAPHAVSPCLPVRQNNYTNNICISYVYTMYIHIVYVYYVYDTYISDTSREDFVVVNVPPRRPVRQPNPLVQISIF